MNSEQIKREYKKQRSRIQRFLSSARKRGYLFEDNVLPSIPKKITEGSIRRLKKLTPKTLYEKANYLAEINEEGEPVFVSGRKGRNIEREKSAKKAVKTRKKKESKRKWDEFIEGEKEKARKNREKLEEQYDFKEPEDYLPELTQDEDDTLSEELEDIFEEEDREYQGRTREELEDELERLQEEVRRLKKELNDDEEPNDFEKYLDEQARERRDNEKPSERFYADNDDYEQGDEEGPEEEDAVFTHLEELIERWEPSSNWTELFIGIKEGDVKTVRDVLYSAINEVGRNEVARNAQNNPQLEELLEGILYDSGSKEYDFSTGRSQVNADINKFKSLLLGRSLTPDESMDLQDLIDQNHAFEDAG